ncbi:hypothetical protein CRYUN_Cryun13aG0124100 [Craigia yunnanensis]
MAGGGMPNSAGSEKNYPGKFTSKVLLTCIVAATGGEVTSMDPYLEKFFPHVYRKPTSVKPRTINTSSLTAKY